MPVVDKALDKIESLLGKALEDALTDATDELADVKKAYKGLIGKFATGATAEDMKAFAMIKRCRRELQEFLIEAGNPPSDPVGEYPYEDENVDEDDDDDDDDDDN